ncbi:MAG: ABC transporter ATP-binding protein [Oscillospiraceae bacterium]|nr:ABC transporter ATP-binding protein [Oscillospiraceae bacterium]
MIEVKHLTKRYGDHTALSDLSFSIEKGQIYGFLGPNGAGKSTTMNIMTGCLAATSGSVTIDGFDIFEEADEAKKRIGYLPELPPLYLDRTPREYLTFVGRAKKIPSAQLKEKIEEVMKVTQITDVADRLIKNLSKGYKQRVGIAQAILGDPEVIILDEPTVGLDPKQIIEIRDLIQRLGKKHTVILSSHILSEVQAICQTILIISKGKLVACDTAENLERLFAGTTTVDLVTEAKKSQVQQIMAGIGGVTGSKIKELPEGGCSVRLESGANDDKDFCRQIFFAFAEAKQAILQMSVAKASLEDIFIELTTSEHTDVSSGSTAPSAEESAELQLENNLETEKEEKE